MDFPIRILQVVTVMNMGGIENFIMNVYRNIDRTKIQFDFLVHRNEKGFFDEEIKSLGGEIFILPALSPFTFFRYKKEFTLFLKEHKYNTIHSHINATSTIVLAIAKKNKIPHRIAHSHADSTEGKSLMKNSLKKFLKNFSTHNLACSDNAGKWLFGINNYEVLSNGIDVDKFLFNPDLRSRLRKKMNIHEQDFVVGHVGRFSKVKNHDFIFKVFKKIVENNSNSKLILIGNGELRREIELKIEELGLQNKVILTGIISNANEYLNVMDTFIFPSFFEGFPLSLIEAQAAGLPSIISKDLSTEIDLTDLVIRMSIYIDEINWSKAITETKILNERMAYNNEVAKSRYNIKFVAKKVEQLYLNH